MQSKQPIEKMHHTGSRRQRACPLPTAFCLLSCAALSLSLVMPSVFAEEIVIYGFEKAVEGWVVPEWAKASNDYVGKETSISREYAEEGVSSLEIHVDFPGGRCSERAGDVDEDHSNRSCRSVATADMENSLPWRWASSMRRQAMSK